MLIVWFPVDLALLESDGVLRKFSNAYPTREEATVKEMINLYSIAKNGTPGDNFRQPFMLEEIYKRYWPMSHDERMKAIVRDYPNARPNYDAALIAINDAGSARNKAIMFQLLPMIILSWLIPFGIIWAILWLVIVPIFRWVKRGFATEGAKKTTP